MQSEKIFLPGFSLFSLLVFVQPINAQTITWLLLKKTKYELGQRESVYFAEWLKYGEHEKFLKN